ncbi:calcium:proton antiporter [Rhabdaerophilum calidifontis]|uniref:calcium:proton antiporter n=1 Tax=Rhabdaerophilum calidifontis TaxID=2604328 RepID=UPI00123BF749|nr:ionic transporter y4hA [Rhabdaerophilum calidifontis]
MAGHSPTNPHWTWLAPAAAMGLLAAKFAHLVPPEHPAVLALAALLLGAAVFAAVHHAEILALRLGEPFGSILLAVAVTIIEVGLIVSIMLSGAEGAEGVARDTVFAAVMIVLNGVIGLCLLLGGQRHHEQLFQLQGAASALAVLGTLAAITLILPNFTLSAPGPAYSSIQVLVVGALSLFLWGAFVLAQTIRHRDYFLDAQADESPSERPKAAVAAASLALLILALTAVILLAKVLSAPLDRTIAASGLPKAFVGVVIATIVLLPEGIAATKSALRNRLQNSINLAIGSAIASIGLTVPTVGVLAVTLAKPLDLGVSPSGMTLLVMTLFVSTLTLGTGRTTALHGAIHLVIFVVFLLISAIP